VINRVFKTLVAGVATVSLVGAPAIAMIAVGPAGATTPAISPVGRYNATISLGGSSFVDPLKVNVNGTFGFTGGPHGTWTETGNVIHMAGTIKSIPYSFAIKQLGKKLGSTTKQGTVTAEGTPFATWYAVRG